MDLELTDEQAHLRAVAAEALDARSPLSLARAFLDGAGDPSALWDQLAELGWYGVGVEDGDGLGVPGLCVLAHELGRHVAPTLIVDSVVVARILGQAGNDEAREKWLAPIIDGDSPVALAVLDGAGTWDPRAVETQGTTLDGGGHALSGAKLGVHHADRARAFAVLARSGGRPGLFLLAAGAPGTGVEPERALDPSSHACAVLLDGAAAQPADALTGPDSADAIERGFLVGAIAAAAEGLGAASECLDLAVAYAHERRQYGSTIGSFQAIQHLLAEMHVLRETAWSSVLYAAAAVDEGIEDAEEAGAVAKAHASHAAQRIAEGALQVFGGIGFTWEHDVHLLARRALACGRRFGDTPHHETRLGALLAGRIAREAPAEEALA
jgi:alkylation response protein AidB-like acyl-CoA dehydrogenase